jgi:hypothetical protein
LAPPGRGAPIIDRDDHVFPEDGCHVSSARVFLRLIVLREGPHGHEIPYHVIVLELVLDGVRIV